MSHGTDAETDTDTGTDGGAGGAAYNFENSDSDGHPQQREVNQAQPLAVRIFQNRVTLSVMQLTNLA